MRHRAVVAVALLAALVLAGTAGGADTTPPAITVTSTFAAMTDADSGEFDPPDVALAAGPGFVVELVNLEERVWTVGGGAAPQAVQTQQLVTLFGAGADQLTDPRLEYDALSGRWFATVSDIDEPSVLLAVSKTSDPTQGWTVTHLRSSGCADQPRLGIAGGVVVVGADLFSVCDNSGRVLGSELWIVNKNVLLQGSTSPPLTTYGPNTAYSTLSPVQSLSDTSTEYVVSVDNPSSSFVHLLAVTGIPPATVQVREVAPIGITPLQAPPDLPGGAQQPPNASGSSEVIAVNDDRILDAVWESGHLWFSANDSCTPAGDSVVRSCSRIGEISTATHTLAWDFDLGDAGAYTFFPALRPDGRGNLLVAYGESSTQINPQLRAIVRAPDGTFSAPAVVAQSAGPHISGRNPRYGDYFGAARDPMDPATIWVAGEIGSTVAGGVQGWNTVIGSALVSGGGGTSPPPVVTVPAPPRLKALASAGRANTSLRLRYVALDAGTSVREQLTVRNLLGLAVYNATTPKNSLAKGKTYSLPWRAHRAGRFSFCVRSIAPNGSKSAVSCAFASVR